MLPDSECSTAQKSKEEAELEEFQTFIDHMANKDDNWKFWSRFVFKDALSFISLYLAVRSSNWTLRVASIKEMAAVFAACDRLHYHRLIPQHLVDLATMPPHILSEFEQDQFTVSISGRSLHDVAVDESHEMLINKGIKGAVVRPSALHLRQTAKYCQFREKALDNLLQQIGTCHLDETSSINRTTIKQWENTHSMLLALQDSKLLPLTCTNHHLRNTFAAQVATPEQRYHLMSLRELRLTTTSSILSSPIAALM